MNYEERYGERLMSDVEERLEQERIDDQERLENLEKCIQRIKDVVYSELLEPKEMISEIKYELDCLK